MTHRKNFIPVLLPVILRYEVRQPPSTHSQISNNALRFVILSNMLRLLKLPSVSLFPLFSPVSLRGDAHSPVSPRQRGQAGRHRPLSGPASAHSRPLPATAGGL